MSNDGREITFPEPFKAFVVSAQAPDVVRMLTGPAKRTVETEISAVHGFGILDSPLFEQQCTEGMAHRLHPSPGFIVGKTVI